MDESAGPALRVAGLWVYPVKSLGGVALREARVGPLGIDGDRRWMLVDAAGRALTQREHAEMARFAVALGDGGHPVVTAPDGAALALTPLPAGGPRRRAEVFGDVVDALAAPPAVDAWFAERLGAACHLVALPADADRRVDPHYAAPHDRTAFTDGYPVLVANHASLDELNARLVARGEAPVGMERFRPSVLLDGAPAWAEDGWSAVHAGEVALALVKPCARCVVTTVDPVRGVRTGPEPLRTLAEYRRVGAKVLFAQNAVVRAGGLLRVGDAARAEPHGVRHPAALA
jgi:uncharacterized protein YcbX